MLASGNGAIRPLKALCSALNLLWPNQHCLKLGEPKTIDQSLNSTSFKENVGAEFMNSQAFTSCLIQPISKV